MRGDRQEGPARGSAAASAIHEPLAKESRCHSQAVRGAPRVVGAPGPEVRTSSRALATSLMETSPFQPPHIHSPLSALLPHPRPSPGTPAQPCGSVLALHSSRMGLPSPGHSSQPGHLSLGSKRIRIAGTRRDTPALPSHRALEALPFWPSRGRAASEPSPTPAQRKAWGFQSVPWWRKSLPETQLQQEPPRVSVCAWGGWAGSVRSSAIWPLLLVSPQPLSRGCVWAGTPPHPCHSPQGCHVGYSRGRI